MNTNRRQILFSNHAVKQMFLRNIDVEEVTFVISNGEAITEYPDDKPFPSKIIFASVNNRALHVVCSFNERENIIIVITVYEPSISIWENDFKTRKE